LGHGGDTIFATFAGSNHDLLLAKIEVFDPEFEAFGLAESTAIENLHNQPMNAGHLGEDGFDFFGGENGREIL
jgi:hypothetical protein